MCYIFVTTTFLFVYKYNNNYSNYRNYRICIKNEDTGYNFFRILPTVENHTVATVVCTVIFKKILLLVFSLTHWNKLSSDL